MSVGQRLKEEREKLGFSQAEVAGWVGMVDKSQSNYENNKSAPNTDYLGVLALHGFDIQYIVTGVKMTEPVVISSPYPLSELEEVELKEFMDSLELVRVKISGVEKIMKRIRKR